MSIARAARAKNDPLLLGAALAVHPALLLLQTLVSVAFHAAFPVFFAIAFLAADVAVMVALALLARSERERSTAIGTAMLVAFGAVASLLSLLGRWGMGPKEGMQDALSSAAGAVSFVSALAVFAIVASIARAADAPFRIPTTLAFVVLSCVAIIVKVLRIASGEGRSAEAAWFDLVVAVVRASLPVVLAFVTSRAARTNTTDVIAEEPPPMVTLDASSSVAVLRGLRAIRLALYVRIGLGVAFVIGFGSLVSADAGYRMSGAPVYVIPLSSVVGAIVTMLGYLRARPIGAVADARVGWLVSQTFWVFVVLVDVVTLFVGLGVELESRGERLGPTLAFVAYPAAMTLLLELAAAMWTARALRRVGETLRTPLVVRRAGNVLALAVVGLGAFFATIAGSWSTLDANGDLGWTFVLVLGCAMALLASASLGSLGGLLRTLEHEIARGAG